MTDEVIQQSTSPDPVSTTLEDNATHARSGGGKVDTPVEPEAKPEVPAKPESVRDSLKAELDKEKTPVAKEVKPVVADEKAEKSAVPEKEIDASEQVKEQQTERKSEVRDRPEPPARFLPRAKELWRNTPNEVQSEVSRIVKEHEQEVSQYRESHQFREELREFEELGKQHNVTLKQALQNYVGIERKFSEDPSEGFKQLFSNLNMQPQQALAHILRAYGIQPERLAAHMAQSPHEYTALARQHVAQQQQQVRPQEDPRIAAMSKQIQDMQIAQAHKDYVEPFLQEHPRYHELEQDIAFFLQSGKIPANLSPAEKLAAAYDMAERINPSSNVEQFQTRQASTERRVDEDFNGSKSIKSSPGNVLEVKEPEKKMSTREMLEDEMRKLKRSSGA